MLLLTAVVPATTVTDGSGLPAFGLSSVFPREQYGRCEMMMTRIDSQKSEDRRTRHRFVFLYIISTPLAGFVTARLDLARPSVVRDNAGESRHRFMGTARPCRGSPPPSPSSLTLSSRDA